MNKELKPCPFCGSEAIEMVYAPRMDVVNEKNKCRCGKPGCIAGKLWFTIEQWNKRHDSRDEYDTMIILQVEYNKMTGEELEKDVAFAMARALTTGK